MKRRHFLGVSMARRVETVRPRSERDIPTEIIEYAPPDPPRRLSTVGAVIIAVIAGFGFVFALSYAIGGRP